MDDQESNDIPEDPFADEQKTLKLEKNAIVSFLTSDFWQWFQKSRKANPSGLITQEFSRIFSANPPNWFEGHNAEWAQIYRHSKHPQLCSERGFNVPSDKVDLRSESIDSLYEETMLSLYTAFSLWTKERGVQLDPALNRLKTVLALWHTHTHLTRFPENPVDHIKIGLTTACQISYGIIEAVSSSNDLTSVDALEAILKHPGTIQMITRLASLSIDQLSAFENNAGSNLVRPLARRDQLPTYRRKYKPEFFSVQNGAVHLKDRQHVSKSLDPRHAPHTGCPVTRGESRANTVLPELWLYFVDLFIACQRFKTASLRDRFIQKMAARESGLTLLNYILRNREAIRGKAIAQIE